MTKKQYNLPGFELFPRLKQRNLAVQMLHMTLSTFSSVESHEFKVFRQIRRFIPKAQIHFHEENSGYCSHS